MGRRCARFFLYDIELLIDVITNHDLNNSDSAKEVRRKYELRLINLVEGHFYEVNGHTIVKVVKDSRNSRIGSEPIVFDIPEEAKW